MAPSNTKRTSPRARLERPVEFAIKLPGRDGDNPVPCRSTRSSQEDYQRLQAAQEAGDLLAAELAGKALEARVKLEAKTSPRSMSSRRIPPISHCFTCRSRGCSPKCFAGGAVRLHPAPVPRHDLRSDQPLAYLNSLQMGFRTLAIQQRSSESGKCWAPSSRSSAGLPKCWRYEAAAPDRRQYHRSGGSRTRQIERKLKDVEVLPGTEELQEDLQLEEKRIAGIRPVVK